jgi:hypothetical protein
VGLGLLCKEQLKMSDIKENDLVFIKPPPPPVGKVIEIWEDLGAARIEWKKGYETTHLLRDLKRVSDHPGEYQVQKELLE